MSSNSSAHTGKRWSRTQVLLVVAFLLLLPVAFGVGLGWYGLNPLQAERFGPVASFSHELLKSFPDSSLVVEIAAPPGSMPPAASISVLWARMNETLSKSSIVFHLEAYTQSSSGPLAVSDLLSLEGSVRQSWPAVGTMALFYLVVSGTYADGNSVIGLAYAGSSIAVFPSVVPGGGSGSNAGILSTVLVHEFGHEIGLVGLVGSAPNEDTNHPGHSTDPNDVMYWQVETTAVLGGLFGGQSSPTQFDAADLADLQTVKNTPIPQEFGPWAVLGVVLVAALAIFLLWRRER